MKHAFYIIITIISLMFLGQTIKIGLERDYRRMVIQDVSHCEQGYIKSMEFCTRAYGELEKIQREGK